MQSYPEGTVADGPNGPIVFRGGQWVPVGASGPQTVGTPKPGYQFEAPKAQADLANAQTTTATNAAKLPYVAPQAAADAQKAALDAERLRQLMAKGPEIDQVKANALAGYNYSMQLDSIIKDLEQKYKAGPGSTKGIWGLEDYLPTPTNEAFDTAGNAARGIIGQTLGFTGSQLNTENESKMSVGPYLPKAGDWDTVIEDKIRRLKDLSNAARLRAIQQLGGIPDANGNVTPVQPGQARRPIGSVSIDGTPPGDGGPMGSTPVPAGTSGGNTMSLSQGDYTTKLVDPSSEVKKSFGALLKNRPSDDQLRQWGMQNGFDVSPYIEARRKNPGVVPTLGKMIQRTPLTGAAKYINRISSSDTGAGVIGAADAVTGGFLDNMTADPEQTRAIMALMRQNHPKSTLAGNLGGGVLAAGSIEGGLANGASRLGIGGAARFAPLVADTLYGAANGAGNADDGNRLAGAAMGGALGAGFGAAGRGTARAVGGAARGVQDASVRYLADRGIPLTVGQTLGQGGLFGRAVKGVEDRLSGIPIVGDAVNARRAEGLTGFNAAAFNDALAPIGANTGGTIGPAGVNLANDAVNAGYGRALNGVSVAPDAQFTTDLASTVAAGRNIPRTGAEFGHVFDTSVAPVINAPAGPMGGRQIQDILQTTRGTNFGNDAMGNAANEALGNVSNTVSSLVERQAPGVMGDLRAANNAYRQTGIVRDAVNAARNGTGGDIGTFTPSQLTNAAAANARRFGGTHGTTAQPFFELTDAAQRVLPSKVPDSGTAGRLALLSLPAVLGGAGSGVGYAAGDAGEGSKVGLGLGALLALGGTRAGQRILTSTLLDRPDFAVRVGNKIIRRQGMFGAPAVAGGQLLLQQ